MQAARPAAKGAFRLLSLYTHAVISRYFSLPSSKTLVNDGGLTSVYHRAGDLQISLAAGR